MTGKRHHGLRPGRRQIDLIALVVDLPCGKIEGPDNGSESFPLETGIVDRIDRFVGVVEAEVQRLARGAGAVERSVRHQIPVVELPVGLGPRRVEHPLDQPGGQRAVDGKALEHRADGLIARGLGLEEKFLRRIGRPIAPIEGLDVTVHVVELVTAAVVVPDLTDRPQIFRRNHPPHALERRWLRPRPGFGVETIGATVLAVLPPIDRRHPVIGPAHLDPARPADLGLDPTTGDQRRPGRIDLLEGGLVAPFEIGVGQEITRQDPGEDARVVAEIANLVGERHRDEIHLLLLQHTPILLVHRLAEIVLPLPLAAPAGHDEDALPVGSVVEVVARAPESLEPDGVEVHLLDIGELSVDLLRGIRQQEVIDPATATDQYRLTVDREAAMALVVEGGPELADPEGRLRGIGNLTLQLGCQRQRVQIRFTEGVRPPQTRFLNPQDVVVIRGESHQLRFVGREDDIGGESDLLDPASHFCRDLGVAVVPHHRRDLDSRRLQGLEVDVGPDGDIVE